MKKILFTITIILTMVLGANAQTDGFFRSGGSDTYSSRDGDADLPNTPSGITGSLQGDFDAPLGGGLLVLTVLGAGYAFSRRKK